jgi:GNAT superfamily N-acetyltransferase
MKIGKVNDSNRQAMYELIFSHMSMTELASFKDNNSAAYEHVLDVVNNKQGVCFTVEEDNIVIGYLMAGTKPNNISPIKYAELHDMRVRKEYQRKGIGSLLVEQFIQWAKDEGYERLSVDVYALSEKNVGFYQKFGFAPKTLTMERWFE